MDRYLLAVIAASNMAKNRDDLFALAQLIHAWAEEQSDRLSSSEMRRRSNDANTAPAKRRG